MYLTRNQANRKVPRVRIPPSPPASLGLCDVGAFLMTKPRTARATARQAYSLFALVLPFRDALWCVSLSPRLPVRLR